MAAKVSESKKAQVAEIAKKFQDSDLVVFSGYSKLTVECDRDLRRKLRAAKAEYKVYKNSLTTLALKSLNMSISEKVLAGTTAIIFSKDPVAPAKVVSTFAKDNPAIKIKGGFYQKKEISLNDIKELATLPTRDQLLSKLVYLLQSPVTRFVNVVQGPLRKLVYALDAVEQKKK